LELKEFVGDIEQGQKEYRQEIEHANAQHRANINGLRKQKTVTSSPVSASSPPAGAISGASEVSPTESGGSSPSSGGTTPSADASGGSNMGGEIANASAAIAEGQRMESAADMGSIFNTPTTNNVTDTEGKAPSIIADAYDTEFAKLLASTS
jgi:hypothetical protein